MAQDFDFILIMARFCETYDLPAQLSNGDPLPLIRKLEAWARWVAKMSDGRLDKNATCGTILIYFNRLVRVLYRSTGREMAKSVRRHIAEVSLDSFPEGLY